MKTKDLEEYLLNILNPDRKWFMDKRSNGLQINACDEINKIAFGVSANLELFKKSKEAGADAVIVHHGLSFNEIENSTPDFLLGNRLKFLYQNKLSLFGYHYLLDHHAELGNNAQILKLIDLEPEAAFALEEIGHWGWSGSYKKSVDLDSIFKKLNAAFQDNAQIYKFGPKEIMSVGVCSGKGWDTIYEAHERKLDLVITGEVSEPVQEACREMGLNVIWGGHYITETFGVKALMKKIEKDLKIEAEFIDVPNLI